MRHQTAKDEAVNSPLMDELVVENDIFQLWLLPSLMFGLVILHNSSLRILFFCDIALIGGFDVISIGYCLTKTETMSLATISPGFDS